jgi:mutator protein MutT
MKPGIDYIGVGAGAIIVNEKGQVFMDCRGPESRNEKGLWEFPGGAVEYGEKIADALRREIREEFGIEIAVGELLDVIDHILPDEHQHWVSPTFICSIISGQPEIKEPTKCSEIGWFDPFKKLEHLTWITRESLTHYQQYLLKNNPR